MIYHTPNYHKLVETVARVCYQSYHKEGHNFLKAIMAKGHISVASVGNMVFKIDGLNEFNYDSEKTLNITYDLLNMHEITPFIKWSLTGGNANAKNDYISMNMLTFLDLYNEREKYNWDSDLLEQIISEVEKVPYLKWFIDKTVQLPEETNNYTALGLPELYKPIVLDEDYTKLKALGLTEYELDVHATITTNFITDRSASLQFWRHWSGGCELSQRYVERGTAEYRKPLELDNDLSYWLDIYNGNNADFYEKILQECEAKGVRKGRAKEIARSILPNAITTQLIQSRPYRNWKHLFNLRDSKHAQREIQEDVIYIKKALEAKGVPTE